MKRAFLTLILCLSFSAEAKLFQNSYVSFQVPDDWTCLQEGVAWTCSPLDQRKSKEVVIVLASKVAGPEDNLPAFHAYLNAPKKITTKVGTPMPSHVMYSRERKLAGTDWIQAQHLGSEIQDFYTLYLATVKDSLAILVSFSSEKTKYKEYNAIFDSAMKSLKIVANQKLLFPKSKDGSSSPEVIGIQPPDMMGDGGLLPPPSAKRKRSLTLILLAGLSLIVIAGFFFNRAQSGKKRKKPKK
ncbi:MAG: hypothetical protein AB7F86_15375 [Bdellovibrionales bacterium]